jgi:hypothetical protein
MLNYQELIRFEFDVSIDALKNKNDLLDFLKACGFNYHGMQSHNGFEQMLATTFSKGRLIIAINFDDLIGPKLILMLPTARLTVDFHEIRLVKIKDSENCKLMFYNDTGLVPIAELEFQ